MASVKESNTSKTAHVMNLLSRSKSSAPSLQTGGSPLPAVQADTVLPEQQVPPIITSLRSDSEMSAKIQNALEAAMLEAEDSCEADKEPEAIPSEPNDASAESVADTVFQDHFQVSKEPDQVEDVAAAESPVQEPAPSAQPKVETLKDALPATAPYPLHDTSSSSVPPAVSSATSDLPGQRNILVNIMQLLVEEKIDKYISLFGLCACDRCRSDAIALALTNLPSKYVVMPEDELSPRSTIYEGRFNAAVTAQILHACKEVFEHPRHSET